MGNQQLIAAVRRKLESLLQQHATEIPASLHWVEHYGQTGWGYGTCIRLEAKPEFSGVADCRKVFEEIAEVLNREFPELGIGLDVPRRLLGADAALQQIELEQDYDEFHRARLKDKHHGRDRLRPR